MLEIRTVELLDHWNGAGEQFLPFLGQGDLLSSLVGSGSVALDQAVLLKSFSNLRHMHPVQTDEVGNALLGDFLTVTRHPSADRKGGKLRLR